MLKDAWTLAIETLSWMQMRRLSEPLAFARTVKQLGVSDYDALRLAHMLVSETIRRRNFIDKFINEASEPAMIEEYNLGVQAFLRLYVYQSRIAKNWSDVNVEEAENIARIGRSILGWKTFQNVELILGVLLTQEPSVVFEGASDEERVALWTFHPKWFVNYCFKIFGRSDTIDMLEANVRSPPTYVRLNTLKAEEEATLGELFENGVRLEKVDQLRYTFKVVASRQPVARMDAFQKGLYYVQDKASCFAVEAANPAPGMTVLDVCAAPGAKTTYLAQLMQNRGNIFSVDYSVRRMAVWRNEISRMGANIAEPIVADARSDFPFAVEADIVFLDPPCTGTGTFGKLPSAKWRFTPRSIDKMAEIQRQMLDNSARYVKPEGVLIYCTCSIALEENEMLIERFLKWHPEFSLAEIAPKVGMPGLRGLDECQRLYPHIHFCNGFFIAKLVKDAA